VYVLGFATHQLDRPAVQKAPKNQLADARGQRRGGGVGQDAFAAEHDGAGHAARMIATRFVVFLPRAPVASAVVVHVPVHGGVVVVDQLGAVHADVARRPGFALGFFRVVGVVGVDAREGDVSPVPASSPCSLGRHIGVAAGARVAVVGPALEDGQAAQVDVVAGKYDVLAGAAFDDLGR